MNEGTESRVLLALRVGVFLLGLAIVGLMAPAALRAGGLAAIGGILVALAGLITIALAVAPSIGAAVAKSTGLTGLFYPEDEFRRPQPSYGPVQALRAKRLFEEAMAGYEAILRDYPDDVRTYAEMMDLAVTDMENPALARAIYMQGRTALKKKADLARLEEAYRFVMTDVEEEPE